MKVSNMDPTLRKSIEVESAARTIALCVQCGVCTGTCPAGRHTHLRTREILQRARLGHRAVLDEPELWDCAVCRECQERCEHGVRITDAILGLRGIAAREGKVPKEYMAVAAQLLKTGLAFPSTRYTQKMRRELGLSPLSEEEAEKVKMELLAIAEATGLKQLVEGSG